MEPSALKILEANHRQFMEAQGTIHESNVLLHNEIKSVGTAVLTQSALNGVPMLSNQNNIVSWLDEIDKQIAVHCLSSAAAVTLAWARCKGTISSFIRRCRDDNDKIEWSVLRSALLREFGDEVDEGQAISRFTSIRQSRDEDISGYTERLLRAGRRAYGAEWNNSPLHRQQAMAVFLDGLRSLDLKKKIYVQKPDTLDEVIKLAKADDVASRRFGGKSDFASRVEMPMEVEHQRRLRCLHCGGAHSARQCRRDVNAIHSRPSLTQREKDRRDRLCFFCHKPGHFAAVCRSRPRN